MLEIVTPERKVYEDKVDIVVAKGIEGELGIMANHVPIVTPLQIGSLTTRKNGEETVIAVNGGFMEVHNNKVIVLAETAELPGDINLDRAEEARRRAQQRLQEKQDNTDHHRAEIALQKAINRIRVGHRG